MEQDVDLCYQAGRSQAAGVRARDETNSFKMQQILISRRDWNPNARRETPPPLPRTPTPPEEGASPALSRLPPSRGRGSRTRLRSCAGPPAWTPGWRGRGGGGVQAPRPRPRPPPAAPASGLARAGAGPGEPGSAADVSGGAALGIVGDSANGVGEEPGPPGRASLKRLASSAR